MSNDKQSTRDKQLFDKVQELRAKGMTSRRRIAVKLLGSSYKEYIIRRVEKFFSKNDNKLTKINNAPKIYFGDIETTPEISYTWGRWDCRITPEQVIQRGYILTMCGKWLGDSDDEIEEYSLHHYRRFSENHRDDYELVKVLWSILDECDIFVAHNLQFDIGWLNARFIYHGFNPPRPYKMICTLKEARAVFKFPANSLKEITEYLQCVSRKRSHEGFSLWKRCMDGEIEAFEEMLKYNKGDIPTLEEMYIKFRPWMKNHPNLGQISGQGSCCPRCNSTDYTKQDKLSHTNARSYNTFTCNNCGYTMKHYKPISTKTNEMRNT